MCYWAGQFDMAHTLATNRGKGHLYTTFFADNASVLEALVFTAQTFVIAHRPKQLSAEQAVALRLESPVINGFGLLHFAP